MLPAEAMHSSLDIFKKPAFFVTFHGSFCQKLGPVYSPNGPMLEFEVARDQNNFIDHQKFFLKSSARLYSFLTLVWNMTALLLQMWLTQIRQTFATMSYIHFFLILQYLLTVSNFEVPMVTMPTKVSLKPSFLIIKMPKARGWHAKANPMKQNQEKLQLLKSPDEKL